VGFLRCCCCNRLLLAYYVYKHKIVFLFVQASVKKENGQVVMVPLFLGQDSVAGEVRIEPLPGKKVEHLGVKIELLGQIGTVPSCIVGHCCSKLSSLFLCFFFCFIALCLLFFLSADML
jgi:hypothetical protein